MSTQDDRKTGNGDLFNMVDVSAGSSLSFTLYFIYLANKFYLIPSLPLHAK